MERDEALAHLTSAMVNLAGHYNRAYARTLFAEYRAAMAAIGVPDGELRSAIDPTFGMELERVFPAVWGQDA